jgi:hypothetical protein
MQNSEVIGEESCVLTQVEDQQSMSAVSAAVRTNEIVWIFRIKEFPELVITHCADTARTSTGQPVVLAQNSPFVLGRDVLTGSAACPSHDAHTGVSL